MSTFTSNCLVSNTFVEIFQKSSFKDDVLFKCARVIACKLFIYLQLVYLLYALRPIQNQIFRINCFHPIFREIFVPAKSAYDQSDPQIRKLEFLNNMLKKNCFATIVVNCS